MNSLYILLKFIYYVLIHHNKFMKCKFIMRNIQKASLATWKLSKLSPTFSSFISVENMSPNKRSESGVSSNATEKKHPSLTIGRFYAPKSEQEDLPPSRPRCVQRSTNYTKASLLILFCFSEQKRKLLRRTFKRSLMLSGVWMRSASHHPLLSTRLSAVKPFKTSKRILKASRIPLILKRISWRKECAIVRCLPAEKPGQRWISFRIQIRSGRPSMNDYSDHHRTTFLLELYSCNEFKYCAFLWSLPFILQKTPRKPILQRSHWLVRRSGYTKCGFHRMD